MLGCLTLRYPFDARGATCDNALMLERVLPLLTS